MDETTTVSEVVARYLSREGFEVRCERDGAIAFEHASVTHLRTWWCST